MSMRAGLVRLTSHRHFPLFAVALLATVLIFSKLGGRGIANYDDCFYAQKAKEILSSDSWMTMYHAGVPSFENPPGFIWLQALSFLLFGVSDFSAIFPSALFGVLTVVLVYFFSRELSGPGAGWPSAFVMATTFFFLKYARHAMIDVTLTFFSALALYAAVLALRRDRRWFLLWGAAAAICVLMKSVLGFFPPLIMVAWLVATRRGRTLLDPWFLAGSVIVLALGCSWYVHEYLAFGADFTRLHFSWLIVQRGFEGGADPWHSHLSYLTDIATTYWPWLPVFAWGAWRLSARARLGEDSAFLLLSWPILIVGVMSLMQTRAAWYIMPAYAAAAMTCGAAIDGWMGDRLRKLAPRWIALFALAAALAINLSPVELSAERELDARTLAPVVRERARAGAKVVGYQFDFHSVNNALLFYSDQAARPVYSDLGELAAAMRGPSPVVCVLYSRRVRDVLPLVPGVAVLAESGSLTLLSNGR
jgi:4-amino-4-deoxy-L-arabinose transferase-like glycosyltransferase